MSDTQSRLPSAVGSNYSIAANCRLAVIALLLLAGCGGGGGGGTTTSNPPVTTPPVTTPPVVAPPPETLFVAGNAWTGTMPANAETVSEDEFRRRQAAGDLQVVTPTTQQTVRINRQRHVESERDFLESKPDTSDDVKSLLAQSRAGASIDGEPIATLPDGRKIALINLGTRIEKAADAYRAAHDPVKVLASYELSYGLLPASIKGQVPTPDSLRGSSLEQLKTAMRQMDDVLRTLADVDGTRIDTDVPPAAQGAANIGHMSAMSAGNGVDTTGVCAPKGLVKRFWFPLRSYVSPVKSQGYRGTCWAFAAIASVESRERVQNDNKTIDLSEQFLVNKYKHEWFEDDFNDGGQSASALNTAVDRGQTLMPETGWTYNAANSRPADAFKSGVEGTKDSYVGACTGYTGSCSETAHESQWSCASVSGSNYCGYNKTSFTGGVAASRMSLIWANGQEFNALRYRSLLNAGVSLLASFTTYEGFMGAPEGVVSDYRKQKKDDKGMLVDGDYGGHLAQIVGFISNEQLSFPGAAPSAIGGGGYFIIRNSWGCAGDGGYFYVPADYVSTMFATIEMLEFDGRRSQRWNDDQTVPGGASGLAINPQGTLGLDIRVPTNIATSFVVSHPAANYVRLTVTSDVDGQLFDGQWLVNAPPSGSLFTNVLPVNFQTEGARNLLITARYGSQTVAVSKRVVAFNTAPVITFQSTGTPQQNENFVVNAVVTDRNEANVGAICASMVWTVTAPDTIVSGTDCTRVIRFGATGTREVRVSARDHEGLETPSSTTFAVAPPPVNPYPRITNFGVYSRDYQRISNVVVGCQTIGVANNAVLDLTNLGCKVTILGPDLPRYFAQLTIENPTAEVLSYDWTYTDLSGAVEPETRTLTAHTTTPTVESDKFLFGSAGSPGLSTYTCTIDVRVNAPQASRSKSIRVWSGQCINYRFGVR